MLKDFQNKKLERKEHIDGSSEKDCGRQDWGQAANCEPRAVLEGATRRGRREGGLRPKENGTSRAVVIEHL